MTNPLPATNSGSTASEIPVLATHALSKFFGDFPALEQITFRIAQGEFVGLLGANGAGKTTLLRILARLVEPTSGEMELGGVSFREAGEESKRRVGFVGHNTFLYDELTVRENLRFYSLLYGVPDAAHAIAARLEEMTLTARASELVRNLSRGLRQRVAIARALLHAPSLLLLDEPFTGLDPQASAALETLLAGFHASGRTLLVSTHNLEQILNLATRVLVLDRGTLIYDGPNRPERVGEIRALFAKR